MKSSGELPRDKLSFIYWACQNEEDATGIAPQLMESLGCKNAKLLCEEVPIQLSCREDIEEILAASIE
jgi:hypothetical protein